MASRKPLTILQASAGELPAGDDLLLSAVNAAGARFSNGTYGAVHFMDAANYYILLTPANSPLSLAYTAARPFYINLSTGLVSLGNGLVVTGSATVNGGLTSDIETVSNAGQARRIFNATGGGTDAKLSDIYSDSTGIFLRLLNDAGTLANTVLSVLRTGYVATSAVLAATAIRLNGLVSINTAPINDATLGVQISTGVNNGISFAALKNGAYGMLFGYDNTTGAPSGFVRQVTGDPLDVVVNNVLKAMRFLSSGRVLVGTTTDDGANLLQVAGTVASTDINVAGTGGAAGAWTSFAATVSASAGTLGAATATVRYKKLGRLVFFNLYANVTNNGSATGQLQVSLPFANNASNPLMLLTRNLNSLDVISGFIGAGGAAIALNRVSDNSYPIAANASGGFAFSGVYEANA